MRSYEEIDKILKDNGIIDRNGEKGFLSLLDLKSYVNRSLTTVQKEKIAKTIEQWLKEGLTPEQFENAKKCKYYNWDKGADSLSLAIHNGFWWSLMPEGRKYWYKFYTNCTN